MKIAKLFVITASAYFLCACRLSTNTEIISETLEGKFRANMELNDSTSLPFILSLTKHNSIQQATIYNSEETIVSDEVSITADSLIITLPVFGSKLAFNILNNNTLTGEFTSLNRPKDYKINLSAKKQGKRFDAVSDEFKGRYKITFGNDSTDLAIGLFESSNGIVKATFATETGDYRFIEGVVKNKNAIINKTIGGIQIPDPNAKITAIQILGTWCPNCMDESRYYASTLFPKYKNKGLAIVGLAFEYKGSDSLIESRISRFKNDLGIQYPIVKAGNASKTEASDLFPQLSKIISFPSTIFLNQKGEILRVHTGFYGPGTGKYFEEYVKETEAFLNSEL